IHRHNAEGKVVEETDPLGHVTRTVWEKYGAKPLTVTDPRGHTTSYAYDQAGNLVELAQPDGTVARAAYNSLGLPTEVVDPGGAVWQHTYDERGNLLKTVDPLGAETRYAVDDKGRPAAITNALGHTRTVGYDAAGLPIAVTDELGHTTTIRRDPFGRVIEVTDPLGHATRLGWTTEGKPSWRNLADGTRESWTWDAEGNLVTHTDPAGNTTHQTAAPFDLPATRIDPDGTRYAFTYDTELRLTGVTNPDGRTWSYIYDEVGQLIAETDFNGRTLTYAHNPAGELIARTNGAGEVMRFTLDACGRVMTRQDDSGEITTYEYGLDGGLRRAANADAEVVFERDALGRILSETVNSRRSIFEYDAVGRRTRRVTPSGLVSEWTYNASGHPILLRSATDSIAFIYDEAGRESERRLGEAVRLTQSWSPTGRLSDQSLVSAPTGAGPDRLLQHRTYAYRADGHLTEIRELTSGTRRYDLDAMGRVTDVRAHGWTETYAYDAVGNLIGASAPGRDSEGGRKFEGTLVRHVGRTTFEHDAQGRLVRRVRRLLNGQKRLWTYAWDAEDRLREVVTPDGDHWLYHYDPMGRRISKHRVGENGSAADRTDFSWDDTRLAEQAGPDGRITTWDYEPGTHRPVAQTDRRASSAETSFLARLAEETSLDKRPRFYAVITDAVGTPMELVSPSAELAWQSRTTLWGTKFPSTVDFEAAVECPLRFPGQYADDETGLDYNLLRYYDPETGGYLTSDPMGLLPGPNPHAYVGNPGSESDPLGLFTCKVENALKSWQSRKFQFGSNEFVLDKKGMAHVLERHHPEYWDGSVKAKQSFLDGKMSVQDVQDAITETLKQNRDKLVSRGPMGMYQIEGRVNGVDYVLGIKNGRVGQFYPGTLDK
ncbi:RHS repeat-associated core domain-containing protein, partial [Streptomyces sp. NPDC004561]